MENGYEHAAYSMFNEANIDSQQIDPKTVPYGTLLHITQKALQQLDIETHLDQHGFLHECNQPLTLLGTHSCSSSQAYNAIVQQQRVKLQQIQLDDNQLLNTIDPESLPEPIISQPSVSIKYTQQSQNNTEELKLQIQKSREQENQMLEFVQQFEKEEQDNLQQQTNDFCIQQAKRVLQYLSKAKTELNDKYWQNVVINEQQSVLAGSQNTDALDVRQPSAKQKLVTIYKQMDSTPIEIIQIPNNKPVQGDQQITTLLVLTKNFLKSVTFDNQKLEISKEIVTANKNQEFVSMHYDSQQQTLVLIQSDAYITILSLSWDDQHLQIKLKGQKYYCGTLKKSILVLVGLRDIQLFNVKEQKSLYFHTQGIDVDLVQMSFLGQPKFSLLQQISESKQASQVELQENCQKILFCYLLNDTLYVQLEKTLLMFTIIQGYYQPKHKIELDAQIKCFVVFGGNSYLLTENNKIYILNEIKAEEIKNDEFTPIYITTTKQNMLIFTKEQKLLICEKYTNQDFHFKYDIDMSQVFESNDQIISSIVNKDEMIFLVQHIDSEEKQTNKLGKILFNEDQDSCKQDQRFGEYQIEKLISNNYAILKDNCLAIRLNISLKE